MKLKGQRQSKNVEIGKKLSPLHDARVRGIARQQPGGYIPEEAIRQGKNTFAPGEYNAMKSRLSKRNRDKAVSDFKKLPKKVQKKATADLNSALASDRKSNKAKGLGQEPLLSKGKRKRQ